MSCLECVRAIVFSFSAGYLGSSSSSLFYIHVYTAQTYPISATQTAAALLKC